MNWRSAAVYEQADTPGPALPAAAGIAAVAADVGGYAVKLGDRDAHGLAMAVRRLLDREVGEARPSG